MPRLVTSVSPRDTIRLSRRLQESPAMWRRRPALFNGPWAMALALLATVAAHGSRETHQPPSNPSRNVAAAHPHSPRPDVPFDVEAVIRRAHFSFRQEDGRFTGGHS